MTPYSRKPIKLQWWGVTAALVLGAAAVHMACAPETRYQVLTFFFDDVPKPGAATQPKSAATQANAGRGGKGAATQPRRASVSSEHPPFVKQQCNACHDARTGQHVTLALDAVCRQCHARFLKPFRYVHAPAVSFQCLFCHHPHQSPLPHLLKRPVPTLCFECHEESAIRSTPYHAGQAAKDCTACHNPHGGDNRMFLIRKSPKPGAWPTPSSQPAPASRPAGAGRDSR